jgi:hypothetical protein
VDSFNGTATTNAVQVFFDPDGQVTDTTTNGPGKSINFWLYTTGQVVDIGHVVSGTTYSGGSVGANLSRVPPWFSW